MTECVKVSKELFTTSLPVGKNQENKTCVVIHIKIDFIIPLLYKRKLMNTLYLCNTENKNYVFCLKRSEILKKALA